jgi:hypothetical protein
MTQDEIIEMAKLAGFEIDDSCVISPQNLWYIYQTQLETFAKLIAAKEREACALICENYADTDSYQDETSGGITTDFHAKLIRARGEA